MSTTLLSPEKRLEQTIELYTKTSVIKRNYYSLYVDNPQVYCICAIFNRIIFFLFGRFSCFLGEAADQKGAISLKQEYALIENYNQAKKELLAALRAISQSSGDLSAAQKWKTAQTNYEKAVLQRSSQLCEFNFSKKAIDEGLSVELGVLLDARSLELIRIFDKDPPLPTSLFNRSTVENRLRSYPDLVEVRQKESTSEAPPLKKSAKTERVSPKEDEERKQHELQKNALTEQLKKTPDLALLDPTLWTAYLEAFKKYHTICVKVDENDPICFTLFYKEICSIIDPLDRHIDKQAQFKLAQALAIRFELVGKDPQFLEHYLEMLRDYYIEREFRFYLLIDNADKGHILLQAYFQAVKDVYRLTHVDAQETEATSFTEEQLIILLHTIYTCYHKQFMPATKFDSSSMRDIAENIHHFKEGVANDQTRAFISRSLTWTKPVKPDVFEQIAQRKLSDSVKPLAPTSSETSSSSSSSTLFPSSSSVIESSSSSSYSSYVSLSWTSLSTEPLESMTQSSTRSATIAVKKNSDAERKQFEKARIALEEQLKKTPDLDLISPAYIGLEYFAALEKYHRASVTVSEENPAYFSLFYEQLGFTRQALAPLSKQTQSAVMHQLANYLQLPKKDPHFLKHFGTVMQENSTDVALASPKNIESSETPATKSSSSSATQSASFSSITTTATVAKDFLDEYIAVQKAYMVAAQELVDAFVLHRDLTKIPPSILSTFISATQEYASNRNTGLSQGTQLLNFKQDPSSTFDQSALGYLERKISSKFPVTPECALQILALKIHLTKGWKLCTIDFLSEQITKLINTYPLDHPLLPTTMLAALNEHPPKPLFFKVFYDTVKELYKSAKITYLEDDVTGYAKLKLEELCTYVFARRSLTYESWAFREEENNVNKIRIGDISKALMGFKKNAAQAEKELAQAFLTEIAGS